MQAIKTNQDFSMRKALVAIGMMILLLWLTGINFLYLSPGKATIFITCADASDEDSEPECPCSPTNPDEKSPDAPVSVTEEFIHEHIHAVNPVWVNVLFQHKVHETEKLCVVHPESFSPPPEA